jgi:parvulin-like peptidyl-prolyl isomerase
MKMKMKLFFSALIAAATVSAHAAANPSRTNAPAATIGTNTSPEAAIATLFGDPVIARGKGFEVKRSELDEVMTGLKSAAAAHGESIPPAQVDSIESQMLGRLIQIQILLQKATDADKADGKNKAETQMATLVQRAGSQEAFDRQMKAVGITTDDLRSKATQEATAMSVLQRELGVSVTEAEAKKFYDGNPAEFEQPETAHVRHILLLTMDPATRASLPDDQMKAKRKQIDGILKRARSGEDFAKLAAQYSEDPGSKDNGGELQPFARGQMVPEFEAAAFSLNTNQISDVITTTYGYHIIKSLGKTPAKKVEYATVSDKIRDYLKTQKTDKLAPPFLDKLKKEAGVEILDPDLKAATAALEAAAATNAPAMTP